MSTNFSGCYLFLKSFFTGYSGPSYLNMFGYIFGFFLIIILFRLFIIIIKGE